jgi:hypothetical protein
MQDYDLAIKRNSESSLSTMREDSIINRKENKIDIQNDRYPNCIVW